MTNVLSSEDICQQRFTEYRDHHGLGEMEGIPTKCSSPHQLTCSLPSPTSLSKKSLSTKHPQDQAAPKIQIIAAPHGRVLSHVPEPDPPRDGGEGTRLSRAPVLQATYRRPPWVEKVRIDLNCKCGLIRFSLWQSSQNSLILSARRLGCGRLRRIAASVLLTS